MLSASLLAFLKESGRRDYFEKIFVNLVSSASTTLYVLNAHLLIEELVFKLIQSAVREPGVISTTDLNYQKKCLLLKALYGETLAEWLYPALASLGALRNKCAHVLDHPKLDEAISSLIRVAYERSDENELQLLKERGKGYISRSDSSERERRMFEVTAQQQHDIAFRLPMACERVIEHLLREWHGQQTTIALARKS